MVHSCVGARWCPVQLLNKTVILPNTGPWQKAYSMKTAHKNRLLDLVGLDFPTGEMRTLVIKDKGNSRNFVKDGET